ncbi:MAG: class I SAM-dependent methyltransferase [Caldilineaceae bacterium]|nr:class I SAM-dependent methyltransferase [Caldilineaceae bacterium]
MIDYEGSGYQTDFWVGQGREYEDAAERRALAELVPPAGVRIAEIGAGFGRLGELYQGYEQVILFDYSRTLLAEAAERWGHDPRFVFVAGNVYSLPLASGILDTLVMVRVMHHLADVDAALAQLQRVLHNRSVAVLEYANKRNLKALMRWALRRQSWSPLDRAPVEFVDLNFDFHPAWMTARLAAAGLAPRKQYAVSHFRLPLLKDRVPARQLAAIDQRLFGVGGVYPLAPSVFVQVQPQTAGARRDVATTPDGVADLLRCPNCGADGLMRVADDIVACSTCGCHYGRHGSVWDMKEHLAA